LKKGTSGGQNGTTAVVETSMSIGGHAESRYLSPQKKRKNKEKKSWVIRGKSRTGESIKGKKVTGCSRHVIRCEKGGSKKKIPRTVFFGGKKRWRVSQTSFGKDANSAEGVKGGGENER